MAAFLFVYYDIGRVTIFDVLVLGLYAADHVTLRVLAGVIQLFLELTTYLPRELFILLLVHLQPTPFQRQLLLKTVYENFQVEVLLYELFWLFPPLLRHVPAPLVEGLSLFALRAEGEFSLASLSVDFFVSAAVFGRDGSGFVGAEGPLVDLAHRITIIIAESRVD